MDIMASFPKPPKINHGRNISVTVVSSVERSKVDYNGPAGGMESKTMAGRKMGVELTPRPSNDVDDPLNWPRWKKETAYASLLLTAATICVLKTLYVTTNSVIATQYNSSYMATAALTGVPFIIAAVTSLASGILAQAIGKRIIFVVSGLLTLVGVLWNMHVFSSYNWFMASRVMQAVGWGATEALISSSIRDVFFDHERRLRVVILDIICLIFTWGSPILGGFVSQSNESFRNQLMILNITQAFAVLFAVLFVPETSFDRSSISESGPASVFGPTTITTVSAASSSPLNSYFKSLRPLRYTAPFSKQATLRSIRALSAPSVLFSFLLTGPLVASAYGIANSLSLLFAAMPTFLFPETIGFIFTFPVILALVAYITSSLSTYLRYRPPLHLSRASTSSHLTVVIPGLLLGVVGLLGFGLYVQDQSPEDVNDSTVFSLSATGLNLSLRAVSLLFGILVAGGTLVSYAASAHLASSSISTTSGIFNYGEEVFQPAHAVLQNLLTGIFVVGFPTWITGTESAWQGLKDTVIAISVLQIVVASTLGALLFAKGESLRVVDRRVLGIRDAREGMRLQKWETERSYMEA